MSKNLVIVESPAKAKTIEKFLGSEFTVKSSFGHIRDLPKKNMGVDIENNFEPLYEVSADKKKTVADLKKEAKGKTVWLASDEDREGEAIAWHVCEVLGLDSTKTKRIVFHEITKPAILKAIENPRTVDQHLVDAQQARRVLDRLVGYELSPVLWRKIKAGLSAGRVQSVAVRLIVEREREIKNFETNSVFKVTAEFFTGDKNQSLLRAEYPKKFGTYEAAKNFLEKCVDAEFLIDSLETKPGKKSPAAPFTTSTLQQEASRKLSFSVKQTMSVAQKLYESGKITYMRTDSVNLSDLALAQAAQQIETSYGKKYVKIRKYQTKSAGAQEAHEAIRPTDFSRKELDGDRNENRLYELIWKRAIASQMADAQIEKTVAKIKILPESRFGKNEGVFVAEGEMVKFEGFLKIYIEGTDNEEEFAESNMLPPLEEDQKLEKKSIIARETYARPKPRFTEASLVKALEEMGIGRPSTYAPTISTIQERGYIEKKDLPAEKRKIRIITLVQKIEESTISENFGAEKSKLFPTDIGNIVNDFLVKFFSEIVDFNFTVKVETSFDEIAEGKKQWSTMMKDFYGNFHRTVQDVADISRSEAAASRELGIDPKSGKPVMARIGRFGPMVQIGSADETEKPKFAPLPAGKTLEDITLQEALKMFEFPRTLGNSSDGTPVVVNVGRFGPYVQCGKINASLQKSVKDELGNEVMGDDPATITLNRGLELLQEKKERDTNKHIAEWPEQKIQILRGPFGIYLKQGTKNYRIPKSVENPEKLTLADCERIITESVPSSTKPSFRKFTKKKGT